MKTPIFLTIVWLLLPHDDHNWPRPASLMTSVDHCTNWYCYFRWFVMILGIWNTCLVLFHTDGSFTQWIYILFSRPNGDGRADPRCEVTRQQVLTRGARTDCKYLNTARPTAGLPLPDGFTFQPFDASHIDFASFYWYLILEFEKLIVDIIWLRHK